MDVLYKLRIILFFIFIPLSIAGIEWQEKTPYGNLLRNDANGGVLLETQEAKHITGIIKWYFYKGCLIGYRKENYKDRYFVINEQTNKIHFFQYAKEWNNYLDKNLLTPKLWTRWYDGNWKIIENILLWIMFFFFFEPIKMFIGLIGIIICLNIMYKIRFISFHSIKLLLIGLIILFLVIGIIDSFPQSI